MNLLSCQGGLYSKTIGLQTRLLSSVRNSHMPSFSPFNLPRADSCGSRSEYLKSTGVAAIGGRI